MEYQKHDMSDRPAVNAAALALLEAAQASLPPHTGSAEIVSVAMMACRNAATDYAGGVSSRDDLELVTSFLVTQALALAERLQDEPGLRIMPTRVLRGWVFSRVVSVADEALNGVSVDMSVIHTASPTQPRKEAS